VHKRTQDSRNSDRNPLLYLTHRFISIPLAGCSNSPLTPKSSHSFISIPIPSSHQSKFPPYLHALAFFASQESLHGDIVPPIVLDAQLVSAIPKSPPAVIHYPHDSVYCFVPREAVKAKKMPEEVRSACMLVVFVMATTDTSHGACPLAGGSRLLRVYLLSPTLAGARNCEGGSLRASRKRTTMFTHEVIPAEPTKTSKIYHPGILTGIALEIGESARKE